MILPRTTVQLIAWARDHRNIWEQAGPQNLGLTQEAIDDLASLVSQAEGDQAGVESARTASKTATATRNLTIEELLTQVRAMLKSIEAHAANSSNPKSVYNDAAIPFPKTPEELDAPPVPADLKAVVTNLGGIRLTWKVPSKNAYRGGTYFVVERAMSRVGEGLTEYVTVGQPADREIVDDTVPPGFDKAHYRVYATRNNKNSDVAESTVNFGVVGRTPITNGESNASDTSSVNREAA